MKVLLAFVFLLASCDKPDKTAPKATNNTSVAVQKEQPQTVAPPTPVVPKAPDYEDVRGVIREEGGAFSILVEGEKPICLPFEAPAEARKDGANVRFTLYLGTDISPTGCREVQTLISMRAVSE